MAKKTAKKEAEVKEMVPTPEAAPVVEETAVVVKAQPGALVTQEIHPDVAQRIADVQETLESFDDMKLETIKFTNDGFTLMDGEEPVDEFEGIIVFTKESNVYYKGTYKAGQNLPPDCASADGRTPNVEKPQSASCKTCPLNQYGSSTTGEGKACKNTRPTFFLVGSGVIPKVLRIPPTSLKNIKKYALNIATNYGSYFAVKTKVSIYKEEQGQTYNNIRFQVAGRVPAKAVEDEEGFVTELGRNEVREIRSGWLQFMKEGNFGIDEKEAYQDPQSEDAPPPPSDADAVANFDPENPQF